MNGPLLLQAAIVAKLRANEAVKEALTHGSWSDAPGAASLYGPAIFDRPQTGAPELFPCVTIGEQQVIADNLYVALQSQWTNRPLDVFTDLHVWTRPFQTPELTGAGSRPDGTPFVRQTAHGLAETKRIAGIITEVLFGEITVYPDRSPVSLFLESSRYLRDPDGVTGHGVLTFKCKLMEPRS